MSAVPPADPLLLPEQTRLIHIGPHKSGTTSLQSAFHHNRVALAAQGVHYAGRGQQPAAAAIDVTGGRPMRGERPVSDRAWDRLAHEVRSAGSQRVFVSSEFLANADDVAARRVVDELDDRHTHVLVTLRPLWKITPSQWQQYVQNGQRVDFLTWLDRMLNRAPYNRPTPSFWHRHRHGELVERWAKVVGRDRITVVVVDDSDRTMLMRTVETMLGLSAGTLEPHEGRTNRSLTWPEVELVRRLNRRFERAGWTEKSYATLVRRGAVREMKRHVPATRDADITLPDWAHEPLEQAARDAVATLQASGVRIVGDLSRLTSAIPEAPSESSAGNRIDPAVAANAFLGVVQAGGAARAPRLPDSSLTELGTALAARSASRVRLRLTRATTRVRGGRG